MAANSGCVVLCLSCAFTHGTTGLVVLCPPVFLTGAQAQPNLYPLLVI